MRRRSHNEEEGPQCGGEATLRGGGASVRRRSHSEEERPQCGGGATVRGLSAEEEPQ